MEQAGVQLIAQGASAFDADMKSATNATNTFVDATEKGGGRVSAAGQIMTGALRHIGTIAVDALAQAARATAAFVGDSIGLAGDFEAGMLNFQAVAGKDVDTKGLEQFRDLFLQIGKELPVSTADVQKAATEMIKGGIDPAIVAAGGLRQNIQFAAAAMEGDLVAAAEISAKILGGWTDAAATAQQKTDFLAHSTDLMTKAANASAVDVKGLSQGIFNAQGIAKTAGVSFDDLTTTLATLAPRFASSSEAGNSLKNMIARLQPTTIPATDAMQALGLYTEETGSAFYDAAGNFVGFETAAQLLQDSLKGLTKEQQAATLQQIFGNDAMGSAAALADMGAAGYQAMAAAMAEANGVAENAALKQQGFNTAMDNAKGSVEALQITIGSYLLPVLTDLLNNVIAPAVNTLTDMADALGGNEEAFARLGPAAQDLVNTIGMVVDNVQNIVGAFDEAGAMSSEFGESIGLLAGDLGLPGELIQDIVFGIQDLIGAFQDGGAGADTLGSAVDDLSGIWTKAGEVVENVVDGYMRIAQAVLPVVSGFVDEHGEEIAAFFKQSWDSIIQIVNLALDVYNGIVPPILNAIAGFIEEHSSEIQHILGGAWEVISSLITGVLETIKGIFVTTLALINGDWEGAWNGIKGIAEAQLTAISGVIGGFLDMIAGLFNTSMDDIITVWENNWKMAVDIVSSIDWAQVGADVIAGIVQGVESNASSLLNTLENLAADALQAAKDALGISSPSAEFAAIGEFSIQGIMQGMESILPALIDLINQTGGSMIDALKKNIQKGGDEIRKMMADLTADVKDIASQINDAIADGFGATASIDRQIAKNLDKFKDIPDQYKQYTEGALKQAQQQAAAFADPTQGAKFFKMRSEQILEYAKLQQDLAEAETQEDADRINAQMILINAAQTKEIQQWDAMQASMTTPQQDIVSDIQALLHSNLLAATLPGELENAIIAQLNSWLRQLQTPNNALSQAYANPPMAASQYAWQAPANNTNSSTYNMPIYTNNSPAALQQSWAVMQASMA